MIVKTIISSLIWIENFTKNINLLFGTYKIFGSITKPHLVGYLFCFE